MNPKSNEIGLPQLMMVGGVAGSIGEIATIPLDTIKVRMQLFQSQYKNQLHCFKTILKTEGLTAFYQGASAGIIRQLSFASIRIGMFDYSMQHLTKTKGAHNITLLDRITWGIISGGVAITVANPVDMIKVRFQGDLRHKGGSKRYRNVFDAAVKIYKTEGLRSFYQSLPPNVLRNSIINAAELASYSQIRAMLLKSGLLNDGIALHFTCSFMAGFVAAVVGSPFDVIKSRMMDGKVVDGKKVPYKSVMDATSALFKGQGFRGFYAGFNANFQRIVSWNIIMFMSREQILHHLRSKH